MIFGYARVSTTDQNPDLQFDALKQAGFDRLFVDKASGIRTDRPQFCKLMDQVRPGDVILIWKLDRLGRSVIDLHNNAEHLKACGVDLCAYTQAIDTSTPTGKLMFTVLAAVAEFERETIIERINTGLETARRKSCEASLFCIMKMVVMSFTGSTHMLVPA